jgi:pimeloyl-ACP methyl ester carboxylesterase
MDRHRTTAPTGERIPKLVFLDWIILDPPPPFLEALQGLQSPERFQQTREALFTLWTEGVALPELVRFVREGMGSYGFDMWARAGREIAAAYAREGNPLQALEALNPPVPVLHLYAQPGDPGYLQAQHALAASYPWFHVQKLAAHSHFPMFEVPEAMAQAIEEFVA